MKLKSALVALVAASAAHAAPAQQPQPHFQILAQAYERCLVTYAVRLTKTSATDDEIYAEAVQNCSALKDELKGAIKAQVPAPDTAKFLGAVDADNKPGFLTLLARIRSDRAKRAGG